MPEIEPIPLLPQSLKEAVGKDRLVVFVGAGVSRLLGCAGWDELARNLTKACHEAGYINFKEFETLNRETDHRKSISICCHIMAEDNKNSGLFYEHLDRALEPDAKLAKRYPIYDELYKLRAVFVTTNADELFDKLFINQASVCLADAFPTESFDRTKLYHLHGKRTEPQSLVFTVDQYIKRYHSPRIEGFLKTLFFQDYTILFVGYGLAELQLLEYLVLSNNKEANELRHYFLMPMFRGEEHLLEFQRDYYKKFGIEVIAYDITDYGHNQLYEVIKKWQSEINLTTRSQADTFAFIERSSSDYDSGTAAQVLQLIKNDPPLADHFFKHVSDPRWLTPLKDAGYFDPAKNPPPQEARDSPGMFTLPSWSALRYLEKVASRISPDDHETFGTLMQVVRNIVDYTNDAGKRIENYLTDWAITRIYSAVPVAFLESGDIDRVHRFIQSQWRTPVDSEVGISLLPHLLESGNKELALKLFSVMLSYRWETRGGSEEAVPLVDEFWLGETLQKQSEAIGKLMPVEAARTVIGVMQEIIARDSTAFHYVSFPSVEDVGKDRHPDRFEGILIAGLRDVLLAEQQDISVVRDLLTSNQPIFRKLSLYAICKKWEAWNGEFWKIASQNLLVDPFVLTELRAIARQNFIHFTEEQKARWVDWIDSAPYLTPDELVENAEKHDKYVARQKLRHLSAIRGKGHAFADELFAKYAEVVGEEVAEEPDGIVTGWLPIESETQQLADRLAKMSVQEIVEFLAQPSQEQHLWEREATDDALQRVVEADPEKFAAIFSTFASVSQDNLGTLVRGLAQAWKAGKNFNWQPVLAFINDLVASEGFWSSTPKPRLLMEVADLVVAGTQNDQRSFPKDLLPQAESILLQLLARTPSSVGDVDDVTSATLNSPRGRVMFAVINYSLRVARLRAGQPASERWAASIREEFTARFDKTKDDSPEFSVSLGEYLIYLYSLDKEWMVRNIDLIFPKNNERHWRAAFSGYLTHPTVYNEFYDMLRKRNHYEKAMTANIQPDALRRRLVDHICFAYLRDAEKLDDPDSMIRKLLDSWDLETINDIVMFFWVQRKDGRSSSSAKVVAIWQMIAAHYEQKSDLSIEEKKMLSHLARLSLYLDSIDTDALNILRLTAKYADRNHETPVLVENLDRLADNSPHNVGEVFLEMLNNDIYPDYEVAHITSAVEKIYCAGERDLGNSICNLYLQRGYEFLREVFDRHNQNTG